MITDVRENNLSQYIKNFKSNPEKFANMLTNEQVRAYGVYNNDFWKSFIVNIDTLSSDNKLKDVGLYENLARIYFVTSNNNKMYLIEKISFDLKPHDDSKIQELVNKLKMEGVEVDPSSVKLIDCEKQIYKFSKYQIKRD